jgi:hypothetical protein
MHAAPAFRPAERAGAGGLARHGVARAPGPSTRAHESGAPGQRTRTAQEQRARPVQHAAAPGLPAPPGRRRLPHRPGGDAAGRGLRGRHRDHPGVQCPVARRRARRNHHPVGAQRSRRGLHRRAQRAAAARPGLQRRHAASGTSGGHRQGDARLRAAQHFAQRVRQRDARADERPRPEARGRTARRTGGDAPARLQHRRRGCTRRRVLLRRGGLRCFGAAGGRHRHVPEQGDARRRLGGRQPAIQQV